VRPGQHQRLNRFQAGLVALLVILVGTYFAFAKDIPFTKPYELKATFNNASSLQLKSPVRIAGVQVGQVSKVEPASDDSTATTVTMKLEKEALPIHKNAELKIRPRIFLEGNFFVDLKPGTPESGEIEEGRPIPSTNTSAPVQLDQVLGTLKSDARRDLQKLVQGLGESFGGTPKPGEEATDDPDTRGQTAGQSLNDSLKDSPAALRGTAIVNDALLGQNPGDLRRLIKGTQKVTAALASRETQLKDLISNFNTVAGALAAEQAGLRNTIRLLPEVLDEANPALDKLNASFPSLRAFSLELIPGVRETPATITAALPWITQTRKLVSKPELRGLVKDLRPATHDLATFTDGFVRFLPEADLVNRCLLNNLLPTGDVVIQDGNLTTGVENYKELFQGFVGFTGESQNFDGNGQYTRFQTGGGTNRVQTGPLGTDGPLFGNALRKPLGTRPAKPGAQPPKKRTSACYKQKPPDLNSARLGGGP
jgi:virulence factor Mce-like protein